LGSSTAQTATDEELVRQIADGDREAFAALYDRCAAILFGIVLRIVRDPAEDEDVLQEVFLQIWQRASGYDARRGRVVPWLTLLARSRALDRFRTRSHRDRTAAQAAAEPAPPAADVADEVIVGQGGWVVRRALEEISEEQRTALSLAYFEGLTQSEIAARLQKPLGTVKTHTRVGLMRLREVLGEVEPRR